MKNTLYDRLEYDAIKTEWHTWMGETAQALRHTDICRFGTSLNRNLIGCMHKKLFVTWFVTEQLVHFLNLSLVCAIIFSLIGV